jgi:NCAIR mutase (PurE)-related protein
MDKQAIINLLQAVADGAMSPEKAYSKLRLLPFEELGYAKVDHHRSIRKGVPEVIFGAGKTAGQIKGIASAMLENGTRSILVTRLDGETAKILSAELDMEYDHVSKTGVIAKDRDKKLVGSVVIVSGGTSDIPVCEEAAITAQVMGSCVTRLYDVGVAGIHRLLSKLDVLSEARVVVAVAGMEGALPSVIGGLVDCPVIAVPTSVGYGSSFGGLSALLTMLNSCASGISVVNIDNGFGAGYLAHMINTMKGVEE